jgi:hypothetical protein
MADKDQEDQKEMFDEDVKESEEAEEAFEEDEKDPEYDEEGEPTTPTPKDKKDDSEGSEAGEKGDSEKEDEKKTDAKDKEDEAEKGKGEKEAEEEKVEEKSEEEKELTAKEKVDKFIAESKKEKSEKKEGESEQDKKESEKKEEEPATPERFTRERIKGFIDAVPIEALPEEEVFIGDDSVNLREWAENDPEAFNNSKVLFGMMLEKENQKTVGAIKGVEEDLVTLLHNPEDGLIQQMQNTNYWMRVLAYHPDAYELKDSKKFQQWLEDGGEDMVKLANSSEPPKAVELLNLYKETLDDTKAKENKDQKRAEKDAKDGLHQGSMKSKKQVPANLGSPKEQTDDDARAAFEEDED